MASVADGDGGTAVGDGSRVRLLFVDEGSYHSEFVRIPRDVLERYERLIDCLREDSSVLRRLHVDLARLCSAAVVDENEGEDED